MTSKRIGFLLGCVCNPLFFYICNLGCLFDNCCYWLVSIMQSVSVSLLG